MSTHSYLPGLRRRSGLSALSLLCGFLFVLQLVLPSVALAAPSDHPTTPAFDAQGMLDLAGVSVVRLVAEYTGTANRTPLACTGLGTLVGSWAPSSVTEKNNWIVTDSNLVNPNGQTCVPRMTGQLTKITVYANAAYTSTNFNLALLGALQCQPGSGPKVACRDTAAETLTQPLGGAVLFSFHTDSSHLQPFLAVGGQPGAGLQLGIELANPNATPPWPISPVLLGANAQPQLYLIPRMVNSPPGSQSATGTGTPVQGGFQPNASGEPGMPIVNSNGTLVGMTLTGGNLLGGQTIQSLLSQQPEFGLTAPGSRVNTLNSTWVQGITQYEQGQYTAAQATLKEIDTANGQFQAALFFEGKATARLAHGTTGTPTANNSNGSQSGTATAGVPGILLIIGLVIGLPLLILLLSLMTLRVRRVQRHRQELASFETERVDAQRNADREVLPRQQEKQENGSPEKQKQILPVQQVVVGEQKVLTSQPQTFPNLLCPNCGHTVQANATYCPNCRYSLLPAVPVSRSTMQTSVSEHTINDEVLVPLTSSQPQQAVIKEAVLDDLAIRVTLHDLWDKAGRYNPGANLDK